MPPAPPVPPARRATDEAWPLPTEASQIPAAEGIDFKPSRAILGWIDVWIDGSLAGWIDLNHRFNQRRGVTIPIEMLQLIDARMKSEKKAKPSHA